jgi:hypothetical protein
MVMGTPSLGFARCVAFGTTGGGETGASRGAVGGADAIGDKGSAPGIPVALALFECGVAMFELSEVAP